MNENEYDYIIITAKEEVLDIYEVTKEEVTKYGIINIDLLMENCMSDYFFGMLHDEVDRTKLNFDVYVMPHSSGLYNLIENAIDYDFPPDNNDVLKDIESLPDVHKLSVIKGDLYDEGDNISENLEYRETAYEFSEKYKYKYAFVHDLDDGDCLDGLEFLNERLVKIVDLNFPLQSTIPPINFDDYFWNVENNDHVYTSIPGECLYILTEEQLNIYNKHKGLYYIANIPHEDSPLGFSEIRGERVFIISLYLYDKNIHSNNFEDHSWNVLYGNTIYFGVSGEWLTTSDYKGE